MKKIARILIFNLFLIVISIPAHAFAVAEQEVLLDFPVINMVEAAARNTSGEINIDNGNLSRNLEVYFDISTNNESGAIAEFQALVETKSGPMEGLVQVHNNHNKGKIILANLDSLPTPEAVSNALGNNPSNKNNQNVIAYEIKFRPARGDTMQEKVIQEPGTTRVEVIVGNNNSYNRNTYSSYYDNAGTYQATIYCTVYSL